MPTPNTSAIVIKNFVIFKNFLFSFWRTMSYVFFVIIPGIYIKNKDASPRKILYLKAAGMMIMMPPDTKNVAKTSKKI